MPLHGNLSTMPLPEVLQWLASAARSGTLEVERNKVVKQIVFRGGRVIACSSDDPPERLGHFLVSRGKISEQTLREALATHERSGRHLGEVLVDMGVIAQPGLEEVLAAKAEETIFSLFDWDDAVFRFLDGEFPGHRFFPVNLRVEEILLRGAQRYDELKRIRSVFHDPGIVLRHNDREAPPEIYRNRIARRIFESVNGERTVAEILLHAHASEYLVTKFLFELFRSGLIEIDEVRSTPAEAEPLEAPPLRVLDAAVPRPAESTPSNDPSSAVPAAAPAAVAVIDEPAVATAGQSAKSTGERDRLEVARRMMAEGEYDGALEILNALYAKDQGRESLRRLVDEAEAGFLERAYRYYLPPTKVPMVVRSVEELAGEDMTPAEFFLLSRIDGTWDLKSIIQITPLREVDALRALKRMREKGFIDLRDPD